MTLGCMKSNASSFCIFPPVYVDRAFNDVAHMDLQLVYFLFNKPIGASPGRDYVCGTDQDGTTNNLVLCIMVPWYRMIHQKRGGAPRAAD